MSSYVLDTDVLSLIMQDRLPPRAFARLRGVPANRVATTSVTVGELFYGALRHPTPARILKGVGAVLEALECLPFDRDCGERYGELRAYLEGIGRRLDDADLRIASICLANDRILISGNERHFTRVPGLRFENWLEES